MIALFRSGRSINIGVRTVVMALTLSSVVQLAMGQNVAEPRREELLNGLHVLILSQQSSPSVILSLRLHSGAAFDLAGKSGTMALLSDLLFPDPETHDFFVDELGGTLSVVPEYDAIDIRMTGRASEFERMLELLRTALISTPITNENVARLRSARIKMIRELSQSPSFVADRAVARRLFGEYPYGRPIIGNTETMTRIDRADLLLARERFLTPDNATLVIVGGVQESRALRALRQLLGAWRKSDKLVPSTFRMPDPPDARTLLVGVSGTELVEVRLATRSLPRGDKDFLASELLTILLRDRWRTTAPESSRTAYLVRNDSFLLSGSLVMGTSVPATEAAKALESARTSIRSLIDASPSASELDKARNELSAQLNKGIAEPAALADTWLDEEIYKIGSTQDMLKMLGKITPQDMQRVANRLFRDAVFASVAVGNETQMRAEFERMGKTSVVSETLETKVPAAKTSPATP